MLEGSSASRPWKLKQFHFTSWPDHGVPELLVTGVVVKWGPP